MRFRTKDTIIVSLVIAVFMASGLLSNTSLASLLSAVGSLIFGLLPLALFVVAIVGISRFVSKSRGTRKEKVQIHLLQK